MDGQSKLSRAFFPGGCKGASLGQRGRWLLHGKPRAQQAVMPQRRIEPQATHGVRDVLITEGNQHRIRAHQLLRV